MIVESTELLHVHVYCITVLFSIRICITCTCTLYIPIVLLEVWCLVESQYIVQNIARPDVVMTYNNMSRSILVSCEGNLVFPTSGRSSEIPCDCHFDRTTFETALDALGPCIGTNEKYFEFQVLFLVSP